MCAATPQENYAISLSTIMEIFGGGGIVAGSVAIVTLWWKIKSESRNSVELAKAAAVDSSAKAIELMQKAMGAQEKQLEQLTNRVRVLETNNEDLSTRMTSLDASHKLAIIHIGEREAWARKMWNDRPKDLPMIPDAIVFDVLGVRPELRQYFQRPM